MNGAGKTVRQARTRRTFPCPQWRGEAARGQTLLIHAEQGFGDTLQFCRYAPLAAARGLRVILEAPKPLARLLRSLPGVDQVVVRGEILPAFDLHCPIAQHAAGAGNQHRGHSRRLALPPCRTRRKPQPGKRGWRRRPTGDRGSGLVWAGSSRAHAPALAAIDRRRSLPVDRLAPLFEIPGLHVFSLQKDGPAAPKHLPLTDHMDEMDDFADTAALIANLDLVISVDTARRPSGRSPGQARLDDRPVRFMLALADRTARQPLVPPRYCSIARRGRRLGPGHGRDCNQSARASPRPFAHP